ADAFEHVGHSGASPPPYHEGSLGLLENKLGQEVTAENANAIGGARRPRRPLLMAVAAAEALYLSRRVEDLLGAPGKERVARRANLGVDLGQRGAGLPGHATGAVNRRGHVFGVNPGLHSEHLCSKRGASLQRRRRGAQGLRSSSTPGTPRWCR